MLPWTKIDLETGQTDEAAKRDGVCRAQRVHRRLPQRRHRRVPPITPSSLTHESDPSRDHERIREECHQDRDCHQPEDRMPAQPLSQSWRKKRSHHGPAVGGGGHAHREPLMGRRIRAAGQGNRHRETGPGHAQAQAHTQELHIAGRPEPSPEQGEEFRNQQHQAGRLRSIPIATHPHSDAQEGAPQHRNRDQEAFLCRGQSEICRDGHAQGADQQPDHEADLKMQPSPHQ